MVSTVTTHLLMLSFDTDTAHNRFATRLVPCRCYVVQSWPTNPLFRCVKSLPLLWKPDS